MWYGVWRARAADAIEVACVAVKDSSQAHSRLHARRVFNGVPCGRSVVLGEARQMHVGDVGDADACWMDVGGAGSVSSALRERWRRIWIRLWMGMDVGDCE